jgi:hypothetical protein
MSAGGAARVGQGARCPSPRRPDSGAVPRARGRSPRRRLPEVPAGATRRRSAPPTRAVRDDEDARADSRPPRGARAKVGRVGQRMAAARAGRPERVRARRRGRAGARDVPPPGTRAAQSDRRVTAAVDERRSARAKVKRSSSAVTPKPRARPRRTPTIAWSFSSLATRGAAFEEDDVAPGAVQLADSLPGADDPEAANAGAAASEAAFLGDERLPGPSRCPTDLRVRRSGARGSARPTPRPCADGST